MKKSKAFIVGHRALLDTYTVLISGKEVLERDALIERVLSIGRVVSKLDCHTSIVMYERYIKLLSLRMADPDLERILKLQEVALLEPFGREQKVTLDLGNVCELLKPLEGSSLSGISVVTCAMNRTENLMKALASWLRNTEVSEVVIVDWSSKVPVSESLEHAGIDDSRIRIIRVNGEPRWILSYAFNVGFRASTFNTILKVDADIVLSNDFFQKNKLANREFIAGNWRTAPEGQAFVNGFFLAYRQSLIDVGGFNEFITTYGWDDDDLYNRLEGANYNRKDVTPDTIHHLPHSDFDRTGEKESVHLPTARDELLSGTQFLIRRNFHITKMMPNWDATCQLLPFRIIVRNKVSNPLDLTIERFGRAPHIVPDEVVEKASFLALSDLASWRLGPRTKELTPEVLDCLLRRPLSKLSRIDVEVAINNPVFLATDDNSYLVLHVDLKLFGNAALSNDEIRKGFEAILIHARYIGLIPLLWISASEFPNGAPSCLKDIPLIPSWYQLGDIKGIEIEELPLIEPTSHRILNVRLESLRNSDRWAFPLVRSRKKLYIDAQHGLGNRLRAIGSAASIAAATERELVIVWKPDHHCNCRFFDLFEYSGAVIENYSVNEARGNDNIIYNYMPIENGSSKSALIDTDTNADIYVRSAFVLNSPHSTWVSENSFLQSLVPTERVRELVASVRHPNDVAVHIRMEAGPGRDQNSYDRPENWQEEDHALIHQWREKSHFSHFMRRIDTLVANGQAERIFIAADLPEIYIEFINRYGDRVALLNRTLYDRSAEQLHYALADAILLGRAPVLLGSTWSSFSELANRLAPEKIKIEMSGKDF